MMESFLLLQMLGFAWLGLAWLNGILVRNMKHFVFFQLNSQQGQRTIGLVDVFALGKRSKISKLIITELFYPHMLNMISRVLFIWYGYKGFQAYSPQSRFLGIHYMALRVRNVSGTFQKRTPGVHGLVL